MGKIQQSTQSKYTQNGELHDTRKAKYMDLKEKQERAQNTHYSPKRETLQNRKPILLLSLTPPEQCLQTTASQHKWLPDIMSPEEKKRKFAASHNELLSDRIHGTKEANGNT